MNAHQLKWSILVVALCIASHGVIGQLVILPPTISCTKNDTIYWTPQPNACGPFVSYLLYGSTAPGGPYSLITTITDPTQTSFIHIKPPAQTWYYYMQTAHNCPGYIRLNSDTISTAPPPRTPILSASVVNGQVQLTWPPNPAPQVDRYIIYKSTPGGTIPIDTVFGDTNYIDLAANPNAKSEIYYVVASDPCGNNSLFDILHQTMFLTSETGACTQTITLRWNPYTYWPLGLDRQEIWVSTNGGAPVLAGTITDGADAFEFPDVDGLTNYCFVIRAYDVGSDALALSNEVCLIPQIVQPPRNLKMTYLTVNNAQEVELEWIWEAHAELDMAGVFRSADNINFTGIQPVNVVPPLLPTNDFTDAGSNAAAERIWYQIQARDLCQRNWITAGTAPTFLQVLPQTDFDNFLYWTPLQIEGANILMHEVFEVSGNLIFPLGQTLDTFFTHPLNPGRPPLDPVCYIIETTYTIDVPGGSVKRISRSNRACATQEVRIWVPNAFAPRGLNNVFAPVITFGDNAEFSMNIYDRWGGLVFSSTEPSMGWNGKINGTDAAPGAYVWTLSIKTPDGQQHNRQGTVMLLR